MNIVRLLHRLSGERYKQKKYSCAVKLLIPMLFRTRCGQDQSLF